MVSLLSNPGYLAPPLVALAVSLILTAVVLRRARKTFSTRLFCCLLLSVGLWGFLLFGMRSSPDVHQAVAWDRALSVVGFATFLLYYHFTITYSNTKRQRGILLASYLLVAVVAGFSPTGLVIEEMRLEHYGYAPVPGPLLAPIFGIGLLFIGGGVYNLLRWYKVSISHEERNRILYLTIAVLFPLSGALLDAFSNLPPAAIWGNLIFSIICTIAIVKYHLLDIRVVVRRSLVYLLISVVVAVPYVGILILLNQIIRTKIEPWWTHAFIILLLAIVLRPLYSWAQQLVDRLFYRERYDHLRALQQFSRQTQSVVNLKELGSTMVQLVRGALCTSSACLLLPSEGKSGLALISSIGLESPSSRVVLRESSPLVKWLGLHGDILSSEQLDIIPQLQSLSRREKDNLEQIGAKLYVPIKTHQGQLFSILVLGQKLSQQSYSGEDKQLLTAMTTQMAMALENARLYEEARESEQRYRQLFESAADLVMVYSLQGRFLDCNEITLQLLGYSREEFLRLRLTDIVHPDFHLLIKDSQERIPAGKTTIVELALRCKDGRVIPVEINARRLEYQGESTILTMVRDITERKQAEERERQLQQEINLSSRLASIGELAAGVAHEVNNPLTGIMGFSQRLLRKSTDETNKRDLERIHDEAKRAAKVVENLRTFARRTEPEKECLNIDDILQKVLEMRTYELKTSNIEVITELALTLPPVTVDFRQIQQVFLNIIMNAEQAITEANRGGKLVIKTREDKGHVIITFTDDGPGILDNNLDKVFDPFFTTRGEKGGTGLGLSICHGIVTEHGGKLYTRSKLGKGTTFFVELPIMSEILDKNKLERKEAIPRPHKHDRS